MREPGNLFIGPRLSLLLDRIKAGKQIWQEGEDLREILAQAVRDDDRDHPIKTVLSTKADHREYLRSDHWKYLRKTVLSIAHNRCQVCNTDKARLDVHHRTYEHLWHEAIADLIVLCEHCHELYHKNGRLARWNENG